MVEQVIGSFIGVPHPTIRAFEPLSNIIGRGQAVYLAHHSAVGPHTGLGIPVGQSCSTKSRVAVAGEDSESHWGNDESSPEP